MYSGNVDIPIFETYEIFHLRAHLFPTLQKNGATLSKAADRGTNVLHQYIIIILCVRNCT